MNLKIPKLFRSGGYLRPCRLGLDLPSDFVYDLRSIDSGLYPIWHSYDILWDDFQNQHIGAIDDPRFCIGVPNGFSEEVWGYPKKQPQSDAPLKDCHWHIWRLCYEAGAWAHIIKIQSKEPAYLKLILDRLHEQATYRSKYGDEAWNDKQKEDELKNQQQAQQKEANQFQDIQAENKWLIRKAMENFERGDYRPTNPMKESIITYPGQVNHSRIVRPLDDHEGGLIVPERIIH